MSRTLAIKRFALMLACLFAFVMIVTNPIDCAWAGEPKQSLDLSEVYLIQDSGWMEPFYADQGSQFKAVITTLIDTTQLVGVKTIVATFDQDGQIAGHKSPEEVFAGPYDKSRVEATVANIEPPRRQDGKYADSDFFGALNGTINSLLSGQQGIVWMISNNKDSPNNTQEVLARTQKFYSDLRASPYIHRIVAFPVRMRVHGPHYDERGFIIYGIAYGSRAAKALDFLTSAGQPVRTVFADPPVRLKPLDQLKTPTSSGENRDKRAQCLLRADSFHPGAALGLYLQTAQI